MCWWRIHSRIENNTGIYSRSQSNCVLMSISGGRQVCRYTTLRYRAGACAHSARQCWCRVWSSLQRLSPGTCKLRPRHVQVPTTLSARRRPGGTSYPVSARRRRGTSCTLYQPGCHEPSCLTSMSYSPQSLPPLELLTESTVCLEHAMNSSVSISKWWIQTKNRLFNRLYSWGFGMLHGGPDHQGVMAFTVSAFSADHGWLGHIWQTQC